MKYHIVILGCQMNYADAERVQAVMAKLGYTLTQREEEADVIGIIACSVRQKAIDKVYSKIAKWNKWKNKKNLITFVSGCVLPDDRMKFLKLFDLVFDMKELASFPAMLSQYGVTTPVSNSSIVNSEEMSEVARPATVAEKLALAGAKPLSKVAAPPETWDVTPIYNSEFEAFIPIQNGCNKFCTFCAVPYTRGREISRPSEDIIEEVAALIERGYKSITLLGQNVNSYGLDKKGAELSFAALLDKLGEIADNSGHEVWIYFTSPHPKDMTRDVIEAIARRRSLAKQIHLPVQSGDDKVLIRMNRKHSMARYREVVGWIRDLLPGASLFTDIIVGFSGESDEQFQNTRAAIREFEYNMAYIAMYSPRPGAASFAWQDDIPHAVKKERYAVLTGDLEKVALAYTRKMKGETVRMLVRAKDRKDGYLTGHTEGKIIVRFLSEDESLIGQFVDVRIESVRPFSAEGAVVKEVVEA
ncbi:MAG TPA: tRNA (N6-isopentenyl adenosine(37)-C2)-methylthiotransferase MiaB [Marinilabiliaceae bacterium]|nr:tRNA (N6-isopentenyl adenosine(37)-C2)-methylthiotransferase MiaB [Marinilabiliaceae bacterium]HBX88869.1 tRNA (N6-isopentenyl adenosine(37)-C2)-methylthiotransferase MiaB [Marinilabiliaceae bacterium]